MAFRYLRDPVFLCCLAAYCANRWLEQFDFSPTLARCYLNDVICIPFWVPVIVWVTRALRLRPDDRRPNSLEIAIPLIMVAFLFEGLLPAATLLQNRAIADPLDVHCYVTGALMANTCWRALYATPIPAADS